jgi:hypothetical protein
MTSLSLIIPVEMAERIPQIAGKNRLLKQILRSLAVSDPFSQSKWP